MKRLQILLMVLCLTACSDKAAAPHPVIEAHVAAFNAQDLEAMQAQEHPDIEWLTVNASVMNTDVNGRDELALIMEDMFASPTQFTGRLRDWSVNGKHVSVTETAYWTDENGEAQSQSTLTVYELEDNLIRRVYYFPAIED